MSQVEELDNMRNEEMPLFLFFSPSLQNISRNKCHFKTGHHLGSCFKKVLDYKGDRCGKNVCLIEENVILKVSNRLIGLLPANFCFDIYQCH